GEIDRRRIAAREHAPLRREDEVIERAALHQLPHGAPGGRRDAGEAARIGNGPIVAADPGDPARIVAERRGRTIRRLTRSIPTADVRMEGSWPSRQSSVYCVNGCRERCPASTRSSGSPPHPPGRDGDRETCRPTLAAPRCSCCCIRSTTTSRS